MTTPDTPTLHPERRGYDADTDTYHAHHDGDRSLSTSVCRAVAAVTGDDVTTTRLLPDATDFDALDGLFTTEHRPGHPTDHVTLSYDECEVTVYRNGHIVIDVHRADP